MGAPGRFSFVDESDAVRRLGVDRDTLLALVAAGRLRSYPGVGKGHFFRVGDLQALAEELHPAEAEPEHEEPAESTEQRQRRQHDPAYRVHLRLVADLKWYDLSDDDLRAWLRELHPDAYERQRTNISTVIGKLQRLLALMDETAAGWHQRPPGLAAPDARKDPADATRPAAADRPGDAPSQLDVHDGPQT
jgi:hypothetical protein